MMYGPLYIAPPRSFGHVLGQARTLPSLPPGGRDQMRVREFNPKGIEGRIDLLRGLMHKSVRDPMMRYLGLQITHGCPWRDDRCELEAIWHFMHRNIRYTGDIAGLDTFQSARRTLQFRGGDCDDGMTLIGALASANGFYVKGRITTNPGAPRQWAHIYPLVGVPKVNPKRWFPLDWTLGFRAFGRHPPQARYCEFDADHVIYSPDEIRPDQVGAW
jgi:hypothetical protein